VDLEVNFDQSQSSLPSGFVAAVDYVVSYFDSLFSNNVTLTIDVGFGEIDGQALQRGDIGESLANGASVGYGTVRNALIGQGAPGSSTLPTTSPAGGASLFMASSEQKALGIVSNNGGLDGWAGFSAQPNTFSYAINSAPPSNEYYFVGVVEHEFTEVMGRASYLDEPGLYSAMDLYRYAGPNSRQLTTGAPSYFSINNGGTDLNNWNNFQTGDSGDLGDWAPSAGNDAFDDAANPGVVNSISQADLTLMNALGWRTSPASSPNFFVTQGSLDVVTTLNGSNLPPPVPGYFNLEVITAPTGTNYSLPSGYQGVALIGGDGGSVITLLSGDFGVVDSTSGVQIVAGPGNQSIGGASSDTIMGGTGNQFIDGTAGNESIIGGSAGSETIWAGAGDTINGGGAANETIGGVQFATITGGTGSEFINATGGNQSVIGGSGGNELIWTGAGDTINGGGSANETVGGVPFETIIGGTRIEFIDGSEGNQSITGGNSGSETIWGGAGDTINGGGNANVTVGGAPNDTITGGTGLELLDGWKGNQKLTGGNGPETLGGGAGDTITGGSGTEFINGTGGSQSITAGSGAATIWGGTGDTIAGGGGRALIGLGSGTQFVGDTGIGGGMDSVSGFNQSAGDRIFQPNETPSGINAVLATATTVNGNTTITFADGSKLTLIGISQINGSYFL